MASTASTTPSNAAPAKMLSQKNLNKLNSSLEKLRSDNANLKEVLTRERSALRALKAQHDSELRKLKSESRKKEEALEVQLRSKKFVKATDNASVKSKSSSAGDNANATELARLNALIDTLKSANKNLQDKLKTAQEADRARASELRAQHTRHAAHARAAARDARANTLQLLEELKTKERIISQLRREASSGAAAVESKGAAAADEKAMEAARCRALELQIARLEAELKTRDELIETLRTEKAQAHSNAEKTEIKHRTETFLRDTISDADSAISSAPCSLSPQPSNELWSGGCNACRASGARADAAARESARLTDALRDARDQLELLEFRVLELEDCAAEKCIRENLTDSDSGCVSPGSRIKDSASPEFRRTDSGYKSPTIIPPTSPFSIRRLLHTPVSDAEILSCVDTFIGDSAKSHMLKDHLELMVLNSESAEDRNCLEQILLLLYNLQTLSSSMSDDEHCQVKPKKYCDTVKGRINKLNSENIVHCKTQKVIATITPYSQQSLDKDRIVDCEDGEIKKSLLHDPGAITAVLQESGIFEGVECESRETQTEFNELHSLSDGSDLNTEIQRLNSIREQLEKKGAARSKSLKSANQKYNDEADTLECKCVKLGKRHKQYYERRLKFLEGKISIYESAQDVKESKLAQRLQKEYNLETKIQDLEAQILELNEKVGLLEEECVELDECENDTRLHCQQLEIDYELINAQLRDMIEQRDLSKVQIDKLQCILQELQRQSTFLEDEGHQLREKLCLIEKCIPAIVLWTLYQLAERATYQFKWTNQASKKRKQVLPLEYHPINEENKYFNTDFIVCHIQESNRPSLSTGQINAKKCNCENTNKTNELEEKVAELEDRLSGSHKNYQREQEQYLQQIERLREDLRSVRRSQQNMQSSKCVDGNLLLQLEKELKTRVVELEKREAAYLDMLSQADDMWAEMEAGYKDKIRESQEQEMILKEKIQQAEAEKNKWKSYVKPLKQQLRDLEESESSLRYKLEVFQRDSKKVNAQNAALAAKCSFMETELTISQTSLQDVSTKFKAEVDQLRQKVSKLAEELEEQKNYTKECEVCHVSELEKTKKELAKSCRHAMDLDVTNSELREEVESLENQIGLMQQAVSQCKYNCEEKIKALASELATKSEEVDRLKYQAFEYRPMPSAREELQYRMLLNESCDANKSKVIVMDKDTKHCSCLSMRMQLMGNLIQDLFDRMHSNADASVSQLCSEIISHEYKNNKLSEKTKVNIKNYLLDSILRELKRAINDADLKTKTEMWRETCQIIELSPKSTSIDMTPTQRANEAERLASVVCACAAANVYGGVEAMVRSGRNKVKFDMNELQEQFKYFQEEVLTHVNVKMMEEDLVRALENIVNCSSCLSATNSITSLIWSTDV